jgi:Zn-finger nucleic acid-binding protein
MSERSGIEIDYCPQCRGVGLDRGELDKIIERSVQPSAQPSVQPKDPGLDYSRDRRTPERDSERPRRKESWLSDLFD